MIWPLAAMLTLGVVSLILLPLRSDPAALSAKTGGHGTVEAIERELRHSFCLQCGAEWDHTYQDRCASCGSVRRDGL